MAHFRAAFAIFFVAGFEVAAILLSFDSFSLEQGYDFVKVQK